ncbi:hypothetical protein [Agromyces sp. GXQ0307]|uniref:hypothetical protein n=1 Tax=Agromyces sp. GXQ0307 TaxID=3377835 RepID=UPI00383BA1D0
MSSILPVRCVVQVNARGRRATRRRSIRHPGCVAQAVPPCGLAPDLKVMRAGNERSQPVHEAG